jgi:hypothetical protein
MAGRTDFIVLHQSGPGAADLEVCAVLYGRGAEDGEEVIREALTKGEGRYVAVPLTNATELVATPSMELAAPEAG